MVPLEIIWKTSKQTVAGAPPLESLLKKSSTFWALEGWIFFWGVPWTHTNFATEWFFEFFPLMVFTASDWSRPVFGFESGTDVAQRRRIAQNSHLDLIFSKKITSKKFGSNGHFGIPGVKFKKSSKPYNIGLIGKLFRLRKRKNIRKGIQEMALGRHVVKIRKIAIERQHGAQSKAHGLKKHGEKVNKNIFRNLWQKMDTLASRS